MSGTEQAEAPSPDVASGLKEAEAQRVAHLPGDCAMWFFVLGDMIIFAAYFVAYMVFRLRESAVFDESQAHLNVNLGVFNTLLLLFSSWLIAQAVRNLRAGNSTRAEQLTVGAGACGMLFVALKAFEWWSEVGRGYTLPHNTFFSFYYMLTGTHLLHVLMGLVVLTVVVLSIRNNSESRLSVAEQGATYWHMVDLLWVLIFALVYVVR
jgi:nitric oxide reductase NorE protein